ncbi:MAG: hypothetical protein M1828_004956 [Chrysothrix sp. TS-e1954]|nr:MAG: hypothetical protein M1828_004956 [Chrysothrix sp. TS-e1954]
MQSVKNTAAENFGGKAQNLASGDSQFSLEQTPDQSGKVALVTGGSEGIGYAVTHTLLTRNISKLYILSVSPDVVNGAVNAIQEEMGAEVASRTKWLQCDLSDWKKVTEVASEVTKGSDRLDILVNNAARGIMTHQTTDMGVDRHMALNHIGHVILTSHLLPLLKKTAQAGNTVRIVNQASNAHQAAPKDLKFESLDELNKDYGANGQYGMSKLANILYSRYLARHLTASEPKILVNATHPGFVRTKMSVDDIHEPFPLGGYAMSTAMKPFQKDQFEGGLSAVYAGTMIESSGEYICPPAVAEAGSPQSQDEALGERLMELTKKIVQEKTKSDSVDKGCPFNMY